MIVTGSLYNIIANEDSALLFRAEAEFLTTYYTSIISASLGLAKCLKNGVARPIGPGGCLDGLLSCRHLLAFFGCGLCLVARAACLGIVNVQVNE